MLITTPNGQLPWDDHWQGTVLGADATHRYLWLWYGYNIRLIAVPHGDEGRVSYDHGWCYPRDPQAIENAFAEWNPDTQDEPAGWHKRATHRPRRAPHRDREPHYNRPRCAHGRYIADGCRTTNCPDSPPPATDTPVTVLVLAPELDLTEFARRRAGSVLTNTRTVAPMRAMADDSVLGARSEDADQ